MMTDYVNLIPKLIARDDPYSVADAFDLCRELEMDGAVIVEGKGKRDHGTTVYDEDNFTHAHEYNKQLRIAANKMVRDGVDADNMIDLYYKSHLFDAPHFFDSFCIYIEKDRAPEKQFYLPRRKQLLPCAESLQDLEDGKIELLGISEPPGVGKALANDTPILTRNGWKNHGDLVVGDEVIGMDGKFKKVIAVHPKCMLDVLVEFTNGEKIQCHENHEWMVHDRSRARDYIEETKVFEKRQLDYGGEVGHRGHRYILQLPHREYIQGEEKSLPLDPYLLGVWLGDGANKNPRICGDAKDINVITKIIRRGHSPRWHTIHKDTGVWYFDFDIRKELQSVGMCHSRRVSPKRIPQEYLTASVEQRLELLAGLIDTDGTRTGSKFIFTTAEESLRDTFLELISTFGWRGCVNYHPPIRSSSGIQGRKGYYTISFTPDTIIPCALERKRNTEPHKQRALAFKSIARVEPKEGNCITVEGDGMYLAGKTMIPTHNTTLAEFFLAWTVGRNPFLPNLVGSHNNSFLGGMYGEMLRILDPLGEYKWCDVFPGLGIIATNAKDMMIGVGYDKSEDMRFKTLEFSSIGSGNAGKVRAMNVLYCDDLVDGIETAMSIDRLDKLWQMYHTDLRQRKVGTRAKELHIATRWSLHDVLGRLEREYDGDPTARFIRFPALDENDESNFDYPYGLGYTTEALHKQRDIMDDASWRALYMNQPIEREATLFSADELQYFSELPDREPDNIIAVCDTKEQGADYCAMPVLYQYGNMFYINSFVCDNGKVESIQPKVAQRLVDEKVKMCQIESNRGGTLFAQTVKDKVKELGGFTSITTKWTQSNKNTRIVANSAWAKSHFYFRDPKDPATSKEYRDAMNQLYAYSMVGKVPHDDVADVLSLTVEYILNYMGQKAVIMRRPF